MDGIRCDKCLMLYDDCICAINEGKKKIFKKISFVKWAHPEEANVKCDFCEKKLGVWWCEWLCQAWCEECMKEQDERYVKEN